MPLLDLDKITNDLPTALGQLPPQLGPDSRLPYEGTATAHQNGQLQ